MKQFQIGLEEKKVFLFTDTIDDELAQYNSNFKVPVLLDKDLIIWNSLVILEYLSKQYLVGSGLPEPPDVHAISRSISVEMHSSFF
ncbi:hypothetical protein [uncultured Gammaproteobacteria bacterium]|uniref:glutathione S-transferase N-terminal domain-containing protein n=1 Tax=Bathymodiolus heckerae thiotrophic gill symbiont TaxID=1052212 RepID=UPI0010BB281E|nr:glutathione S-transferase N-terminal domain-containing protein [Bathymodiolus heckerae thiotrophic gill symbiont]CAC9437975.1 hypothetical protein [uncultured Gammaproteobacteria bacterium]SMN12953.1 Glutathione S-transferase [Bathymodiolus heckerae thiotrophic gill symbiont]